MNRRRFFQFASSAAVLAAAPLNTFARDSALPLPTKGHLLEPVSVFDFGVKGDGIADDTMPVQNAIDSASMVFFPPGRYRISSLTINGSGKYLYGAYMASRITSFGPANLLTLKGSNCRVRDLMFTNDGGARKQGAYILTTGSFIDIEHCHFENGHYGVVTASTLFKISDCDFRNFSPGNGICIQINGGLSVMIDSVRADHPDHAMPLAGINITSTGDTTITNCGLVHCGTDLLVNPSRGKVVASLYASNTFFDAATTGIILKPREQGAIVRSHFINCWTSSHTGVGTIIDSELGAIDGTTFVNHQANSNAGDGVHLLGPRAVNTHLLGGEMAQNGGSGVSIGRGVSKFYIQNVLSGKVHGLNGNTFGITIGKDCTNYQISNCVSEGNLKGQILDDSLAGRVHDNVGIATRSSGVAAIPIGESQIVVKHGLATSPTINNISITPTTDTTANGLYIDPESVGQATFTVRSATLAKATLSFSWQASCLGA